MQQVNSDLQSIQKTLLKMYFSNSQKAGVDTRPLTRQLSTLSGHVSEGLGYLAMLRDTLSKAPCRSTSRMANLQFELLSEVLREMESTLSDCFEASMPEPAKSSN